MVEEGRSTDQARGFHIHMFQSLVSIEVWELIIKFSKSEGLFIKVKVKFFLCH
jgi:hypothetical protein